MWAISNYCVTYETVVRGERDLEKKKKLTERMTKQTYRQKGRKRESVKQVLVDTPHEKQKGNKTGERR